ncbi:glycosyltransferase [Marinobacter sp.]|uniref:glycosyltransferase n=1 Tax=Marinobacter sp. TaxID=50741 RepID=UPI0019E7B7F6|nr:glycosyltransferase [Marinobacter sp.]MBE0486450.1 glycosyltransferase [Marinobacter sp.]
MQASELWFVVPGNPEQNTGGYRYVQRLVQALRGNRINARIKGLPGRFPRPDSVAERSMQDFLASLPVGARVILDGLAMGAMPAVLEQHTERLQMMALVHHPLADETGLDAGEQDWLKRMETRALAQVGQVFTTSEYTAARVQQAYGVAASRIVTAKPAVDDEYVSIVRAEPSAGEREQPRLLCVGHLSARKAQHQLVEALSTLKDLPWQCVLVGAKDRDPEYAEKVSRAISGNGLADRIQLLGEVDAPRIAAAYANADLFVFPSLYEGYGMVIDEALAAGLPVLSSDGGALALTTQKLGACTYPAGDVSELARRLRSLIVNREELQALMAKACHSRNSIRAWPDTARDFMQGLVPQNQEDPARFSRQWLETREPSDHAARNNALTDRLAQWLMRRYSEASEGGAPKAPLKLIDVGSGLGSNPAYLIPRLPVPQQWILVEPDQSLLPVASARVEALDAPVEPQSVELTVSNIDELLPAHVDLITASALIDLVSEPWLKAFASAIARRRSALLVVLSYSGNFELMPPHPLDDQVKALVNRHQHGDKGSGSALGPEATGVLEHYLRAEGYRVEVAGSPWRLGGSVGDASLIDMLMVGWVQAACEQDPTSAQGISGWLEDRRAQLDGRELRVVVDHLDLLALPGAEHR